MTMLTRSARKMMRRLNRSPDYRRTELRPAVDAGRGLDEILETDAEFMAQPNPDVLYEEACERELMQAYERDRDAGTGQDDY